MTLEQARTNVLTVLAGADVTTVELAGAVSPQDSGRLLTVAGNADTTVRGVLAATGARFAGLTAGDDDEFSIHLIGPTAWVMITVTTQETLDADDQAASPDGDPELWQVVDAAVTELAATPMGVNHHDPYAVLAMVASHLSQTSPELAEKFEHYPHRGRIWEPVARLQAALKDAHIAAMRKDAQAWAVKVYDADPVPAGSRRPVFRDAAYRYMKRVDEDCATRIATETIAAELEKVATERARTLTF